MAKKGFFEKVLNFVGIEQDVVDEEEEERAGAEQEGPERRSQARGDRLRRTYGGSSAASEPEPGAYGPGQMGSTGGYGPSLQPKAMTTPPPAISPGPVPVRTRPQVVRMDHSAAAAAAAAGKSLRVMVLEPRSFDEVQSIAESLRSGQAVIVNVEETDRDTARRLMDFLAGALYVLGGTVQRIGGNIFMAAPAGVDIAVNVRAEVAATSDFLKP